ncbi:GlcG/HbpS family heme-binding protein [Devosia beringensis]|uniref:GlcG/HbpS family heme-binding protein n=1 Tax=Devosia beringensis TaxID=2657486 RepID=UPI00186B6B25|nr:heme-binding protein [Devosia beringensis]
MLNIPRIDLTDAGILLAGARQKADEIGIPMCIAIVDESGNLVAFERMDGGKITSITIAIDKAYTAAAAKRATHEYGQASQPGAAAYGINSAIGGRLMVVAGGLPLLVNGAVVGGIGISSGTPAQDQAVAQAGIDHFLAQQPPTGDKG